MGATIHFRMDITVVTVIKFTNKKKKKKKNLYIKTDLLVKHFKHRAARWFSLVCMRDHCSMLAEKVHRIVEY